MNIQSWLFLHCRLRRLLSVPDESFDNENKQNKYSTILYKKT